MLRGILFCLLVIATIAPQAVVAQGILIPENEDRFHLPRHRIRPTRPVETSYRIKEISIQSKIENQVAQTQVSQTFVNTGKRQIQASFIFPLPYDGAVDRMTFMVDGKEYEAQLMSADKARKIYEGYVRRNQDPALLEWMGQGMFKTSVFPIPPGASRTVTLRYTQLLRQDLGLTDYLIPLSTAKYTSQPIQSFSIQASIHTTAKIKNIYSPTHDVEIERIDDNLARVKIKRESYIPDNDFRVLFNTDEKSVGASVLSYWPNKNEDGYFVLLASPQIKQNSAEQPRKTVLFVVDRSGSMNGKKMEQAKEAAKFVLNNLREGDLFNIIAYDREVATFEPELQRYDSETARKARGFIEGIFAGGSTNIDAAMNTALKMIQNRDMPSYIVFLTDGMPTAGETNEAKIAANAKTTNKFGARLISFGVGYDVNSRLLDRMTRENRGQSQYVRPDENLEEHVSRLYAKISAPVLSNVSIAYQFENDADTAVKPVNRIYPQEVFDLFAGQQLVVVGRYKKHGPAKLVISGSVGAETTKFEYEVKFVAPAESNQFSFASKLWAVRRIGEIIDLIDLEGQNKELVDELVALSTKHGIITPYTSYLADDLARPGDLANTIRNRTLSLNSLESLKQSAGQSAFNQRGIKQMYKSANAAPTPASGGGFGGGGQGYSRPRAQQNLARGGGGARPSAIMGRNPQGQVQSDAAKLADNVRIAGNESVYRRGNLLIASNASDIDPEKDKSKITEIKRYSKEYFDLLKTTSKEENQLLALQGDSEELVVRLQGKVYRIN